MFDRTGGRAAAPSESARRRLELLGISLAGELPAPAHQADAAVADESDDHRAGDPPRVGPGRHAARPLPRSARVAAGLSDRVPVPVRAAWSTRFSGHHLAVVSLLLAVALCVAGWWALSAKPEVQAAPRMTPVPSATPPGERPPSPAASPSGSQPPEAPPADSGDVVVVDVAGRVRRPGIVTLPIGSRVADALDAAGGTRGDVDLASLNLARVLLDGEQVLVGVQPAVPPVVSEPPPGSSAGPPPAAPVNLNTATQADLDTLPGVGPVTAQAILDWRAEHGGFTSVDELLEVSGIGEVTMEELRPLVTV
jgi:competence protein ComEA